MSILQVTHVDKSFGGTVVVQGVHMKVEERERVGLIGPNGAGKSTLLKLITSQLDPDHGEIHRSKNARIGYLAQENSWDSHLSIWEEILTPFHGLKEMEKELRHLEEKMGEEGVLADEQRYQGVLTRYAQLQERFEQAGGYSYEAQAKGALNGLGLGGLNWEKTPVHSLSGGQKTRLSLAKLLLEQPDLLILDEPTNYLDMEALNWLEKTLETYPGALLVVSHDRYFLNRIVTILYEVDRNRVTRYKGNYTDYVRQREEMLTRWEKSYEQQQSEIKRMEDFVQRNLVRASTTKRAQSRRKALERMEKIERPPSEREQAAIRFAPAVTSGRQVMETVGLSIGYDSQASLIQSCSLKLERGDRIALIGPNGAGKTTLLKTLAGILPPLSGNLIWGTGVHSDYYEQEQEGLNLEATVLEEIWNAHPKLDQTTLRSYLGQFLFQGEEVFKKVADLSGGEKARLSLVKRLLNRGNLLLMDEPTNHLDMESKERLEEALEGFTGTLLFVSHDRYFINRLAHQIWEVKDRQIIPFDGNYDAYLARKQEEEAPTEQDPGKQSYTEEVRLQRQREREERNRQEESTRLEEEIQQLEEEIASLQAELCQPEIYSVPEKSLPRQQRLTELEPLLAEKTERWVEITE
ncbi:ABC-F family ATP-binding cassette domain-containing protein [Kroppenstedtia pulmonis]|uniref:ABC-F family ATP-binding cassette domain-containing protein n=1 Tax=Kroppenstedtia pulmonis TaxID=1380685 RepID=A0A7D4CPM3_9BACL|nr:ABC-F family ATP-binding cassette domain-containing protein [Kroppenstedtia pulmonis]QKG85418.1 ABC-F family ATP-binding cassette domain-containing protein [Kroppenstedtia pulmonis]